MTKPPHFTMIRDFHLADWFTIANAFCGMGAVLAVMSYLTHAQPDGLYWAAVLIPVAAVFDVLDGRIARWRQSQSALGRELDSLADAISFGVAPAAMAFAAGLDSFWDCLALVYFVGCGVSRLARYNITAEALSADASGKVKYFEGTPIPSSVLLVGMLAFAAWQGRIGEALWFGRVQLGPWQMHPLVLLFALSGSLMISKTIRIPKL
ncbi:MAG TPA: CDP-alcohol phosphatidyltransferase family protein [Xanthomonadaceae bacterium]|nr:CDP-alcohol phosphatidyltransferase family protein [Xanthomonadaceae bacterium]